MTRDLRKSVTAWFADTFELNPNATHRLVIHLKSNSQNMKNVFTVTQKVLALNVVAFVGGLACTPCLCFAQATTTAPQTSVPTSPLIENFDHAETQLPDGWNVVSGIWRVENGVLVSDSMASDAYVTFGESSWQNYEVQATVTFREVRNPLRWLSILVRAAKDGERPWSQVPIRFDTTQPNGVEFAVRTTANRWSVRRKAAAASASKLNQSRQLKVVVRGSSLQGFLDGQLVIDSPLCVDRAHGCVGFGTSGCIATFDNVSVRPLPTSLETTTPSLRQCDVVAHRGFSSRAPENTLSAIREAIAAGSTGCEFDVYGCADGHVVLMHDKKVDRTTNGVGEVTKLSLKQLQKLDAGSWKDARYGGESVPTLVEALKLLKDTDCQPVIEIKMEGISKQVVDDVRKLNMVDQVAVIAFSENVVREIRELEPQMTCAWLCSKQLTGDSTSQADWLAEQASQCNATVLDLNYNMLTPELVAELKKRNLGVWTWTVNEAVVMQALQQWGVDSITTDRPDLLSR